MGTQEVISKSMRSNSPQQRPKTPDSPGVAERKRSTDFYPLKLFFFTSLLAWPITFVYNIAVGQIDQTIRPFWMMALGFIILAGIGYGATKLSKVNDWLYTGIVIFGFAAMIDMIDSLEISGIIHNFMSEYLKYGEPYLFCSWGTAISLFDAIGFFPMYHLIVFFMTNGKSWRSVGIYWGSGILNSMIVLLLGAAVGKVHTPTFCMLLNIPFVLFPICVLIRAFATEKRSEWKQSLQLGLLTKLFDLILALGFLSSIWVTLSKALAVFGCHGWPILLTTTNSEPSLFLEDPAPFAIIQAIVFLFYIIPLQCVSLVYLVKNDKPQFLWEMTVVHAGAMMQGQFSYLFQSFSSETPPSFQANWKDPQLWTLNLLILIVPHLFLLRLWRHRKNNAKIVKKLN